MDQSLFDKNVDDVSFSLMEEFERKDIPLNVAASAMLKIVAWIMGVQKLESINSVVDDFRKMCLQRYELIDQLKEDIDQIMENRNEPK